jgi:hypothetical protein
MSEGEAGTECIIVHAKFTGHDLLFVTHTCEQFVNFVHAFTERKFTANSNFGPIDKKLTTSNPAQKPEVATTPSGKEPRVITACFSSLPTSSLSPTIVISPTAPTTWSRSV